MKTAMENCPKRRPSCSVLDAGSKARTRSSVEREEPRVEVYAEKKEGTTMTKKKRLDSLAMLRSLMKHPYGLVFNNIDIIRACSSESFNELEKPIDLETIKSMLENNMYLTVEAFAEDVRTAFSNAMQIFPATEDVHKMATKLSENFDMEFKTKMESLNHEPKTLNNKDVSEKKETQGSKSDSSSRKRKSAAASSGREKIYIVGQEPDREYDRRTVVPSGSEKSDGKLESSAERWAARITALMDRFSGTIKKAEKELAASAHAKRDQERKAEAQIKREAEARVTDQRRRERVAQRRASATEKRDRESLENYLFTC